MARPARAVAPESFDALLARARACRVCAALRAALVNA